MLRRPLASSRILNHSSGVYSGGAPVSRSIRHRSLSRRACTIGAAIRRSCSVVWRSSQIRGISLSAEVTISFMLTLPEIVARSCSPCSLLSAIRWSSTA
jgi:hypothetical protein